MMKTLASALRSPQILLPLALFGVGGLIISTAWDLYEDQARHQLPSAQVQARSNGSPSVAEIRSMLAGSPGMDDENLELIAQKNLFTPDREAWQPPKQDESEQGGNENSKSQKRTPHRQIPRSKIRLYGTTITDSEKTALVYMEPFASKHKYHMVHEGEEIRDAGDRGEWLYFKVLSINNHAVALQDPEGESFEIGLFDHQREQRKPPGPDRSGMKITVGGQEMEMEAAEDQADQQQSTQDQGPKAQSDGPPDAEKSGPQQGGPGAESGAQNGPEKESGPQSLIDALKKFRNQGGSSGQDSSSPKGPDPGQENKENMRKIETPLGTIYRPAD